MTVAELIEYLKNQPQHIQVGHYKFSEQCTLNEDDITIKEFCIHREDGWIQNQRPDMETVVYLMFPGN